MTREYSVIVEGQVHTIVVSDDREALLAAKAVGMASVELISMYQNLPKTDLEGLWNGEYGGSLFLSKYSVESLDDISDEYLEQVVRRELGLPWEITVTRRLVIREFQMGDELWVPYEPEDREADEVFRRAELLREYIRCQYGFYGYGIWAVTDRETGKVIGKAGMTNLDWEFEEERKPEDALELGYHIFTPYRRKGYAQEACEGILKWYEHQGLSQCPVYAKTDASNDASMKLLEKLGFRLIDQRYSGSKPGCCLFARYCQRLPGSRPHQTDACSRQVPSD